MNSSMAGLMIGWAGKGSLDLDCAAGRDHDCRQQRRHVGRACRQRTPGRHRATTATGCRAAAGGSAAADAERLGGKTERPERWHEASQLPAASLDRAAERPTAVAVTHVAARHPARADAAVVGVDQLLTNLRARRVACVGRLHQPHPRPDEQRLDGCKRQAERLNQLLVAHSAQLAHQQGRALLLWEPPQIHDQPPKRLASLGLGDRVAVGGAEQLHHLGRGTDWPAQLVDTAVVSDPIEPRP